MLKKMLCAVLAMMIVLGMAAFAEEPAIIRSKNENERKNAAQTYIVPFGEEQVISTQILADGSAHTQFDNEAYETVNFALRVKGNRGPAYFSDKYGGSYTLKGDEAVVEFDIELQNYSGSAKIVPSDVILVTMRGENEEDVQPGYVLTNYEIDGESGVEVMSDYRVTLYKRYSYDEMLDNRMRYMAVNSFNDGVMDTYLFEIDDPNETKETFSLKYRPLSRGMKDSEEVRALQTTLIGMGLLKDYADGDYGKNTQAAVAAAQKLLGLEETGTADGKFLRALEKYVGETQN